MTFPILLFVYLSAIVAVVLDILFSKFVGKNTKLLWVIVVFLAPFFGTLLYLIRGRRDKISANQQ